MMEYKLLALVITTSLGIIGWILKRQISVNDDVDKKINTLETTFGNDLRDTKIELQKELQEANIKIATNEANLNGIKDLLEPIRNDIRYLVGRADEKNK